MNILRIKKLIFLHLQHLPMKSRAWRPLVCKWGGVQIISPKRTFIGEGVIFDTNYPQDIFIEEGVRLTSGVKIVTHFMNPNTGSYDRGKVHICKGAYLGMNTLVVKPVTIGERAIDAVTAYRNMRRTAELKFNLKEAARQYVVLAKLQYINGVIRYIDVLDAQRKFFDAQVEESKAVRNEHLALVGLYKALGGGWQPSDAEKKG